MDGEAVFFAVPAEEYGEIEFKNRLKEEGKILFGGGKSELIRIGAFDDISLALVHHLSPGGIHVGNGTSNGFVSKVIRYMGKEAHAAAQPERGINALNAASLGLSALAFQRETFRDEDFVRVHPIVTKGGNLVNVVPGEAVVETLVRAKSPDAILDAARKTDRAFTAGAFALGAGIEIETMPGYLPRLPRGPSPPLSRPGRPRRERNPGSAPAPISPGPPTGGPQAHYAGFGFNLGFTGPCTPRISPLRRGGALSCHPKSLPGAYKLQKDGASRPGNSAATGPYTKEQYIDFNDRPHEPGEEGVLSMEKRAFPMKEPWPRCAGLPQFACCIPLFQGAVEELPKSGPSAHPKGRIRAVLGRSICFAKGRAEKGLPTPWRAL